MAFATILIRSAFINAFAIRNSQSSIPQSQSTSDIQQFGTRHSPLTIGMTLVWPARQYLAGYVAALERGWSADNVRGRPAAEEELRRIKADADAFLAIQVDREARAGDITMPDGTTVPRLPGYRRWMWDGEFCGAIGFRWQRGTEALPPYCLGHIGYSVVPWKRGRGYATLALAEILKDASGEGLRYVEITTTTDNIASQRVIERNGGQRIEEFTAPSALGGRRHFRYRVTLATSS